jgi:phage-related baseplate assembly protein
VTIKSATIANYAVTAELEIPEGPDASTVLNNAIDVLRSYTTLSHRIKTVVPCPPFMQLCSNPVWSG